MIIVNAPRLSIFDAFHLLTTPPTGGWLQHSRLGSLKAAPRLAHTLRLASRGNRTDFAKGPLHPLLASSHPSPDQVRRDWVKHNVVPEGKYIDPTIAPSPAAWRVFRRLVMSPSHPLHPL
jgi:hypothetical protein